MSASRPFSELTGKEKAIELLRWAAVLPAAMLGAAATRYAIAIPFYYVDLIGVRRSDLPEVFVLLLTFIYYASRTAVFVMAGAKTAPRNRFTVTLLLTIAAILMSLLIHILAQQIRGFVNYTHFATESLGAMIGAAYVLLSERTLPIKRGPNRSSSCSP